MAKPELSWVAVCCNGGDDEYVFRALVPGGWLVRATECWWRENKIAMGLGLTFLPDPNHEWLADPPPEGVSEE